MVGKAWGECWALEPTPVHNGRFGRRMVEKLTLQERRAVIPDALIHACIADAFSGVSKQMQPFSAPRLPAEQRNSAPRAVLLQAASNSSSSALRSDSSRRSSALWAVAPALPRSGGRRRCTRLKTRWRRRIVDPKPVIKPVILTEKTGDAHVPRRPPRGARPWQAGCRGARPPPREPGLQVTA